MPEVGTALSCQRKIQEILNTHGITERDGIESELEIDDDVIGYFRTWERDSIELELVHSEGEGEDGIMLEISADEGAKISIANSGKLWLFVSEFERGRRDRRQSRLKTLCDSLPVESKAFLTAKTHLMSTDTEAYAIIERIAAFFGKLPVDAPAATMP